MAEILLHNVKLDMLKFAGSCTQEVCIIDCITGYAIDCTTGCTIVPLKLLVGDDVCLCAHFAKASPTPNYVGVSTRKDCSDNSSFSLVPNSSFRARRDGFEGQQFGKYGSIPFPPPHDPGSIPIACTWSVNRKLNDCDESVEMKSSAIIIILTMLLQVIV